MSYWRGHLLIIFSHASWGFSWFCSHVGGNFGLILRTLNIILWDSTNLSFDSRSLSCFCGFQHQLCFQSLRGILQICPCVLLHAHVGPGQCDLSWTWESMVCWLVLYLHMLSSGVSPRAHKQVYGVVLLRSSLSAISLALSSSWGLLSLVLQPESRGSIPPGLLHSSLAHIHAQATGRLRENLMGFSSSWDHSISNCKGRFPPSEFQAPVDPSAVAEPQGDWDMRELRRQRHEKRKNPGIYLAHCLWELGNLLPAPQARTRCLLGCSAVHTDARFWVSDYI